MVATRAHAHNHRRHGYIVSGRSRRHRGAPSIVSTVRVVVTAEEGHFQSLAEHVLRLQSAGEHVVFVTANLPYASVAQRLAAAGVDLGRMMFIDAITRSDGSRPDDAPDNVYFLQSPTMLEMIAMRVEQALARSGGGHVVLDSLNALQLYNGLPMVQEFSHYMINRLRTHGVGADLVVLASADGRMLEQAVAGFTDGSHELLRA